MPACGPREDSPEWESTGAGLDARAQVGCLGIHGHLHWSHRSLLLGALVLLNSKGWK